MRDREALFRSPGRGLSLLQRLYFLWIKTRQLLY